jgi:hypothetical protein
MIHAVLTVEQVQIKIQCFPLSYMNSHADYTVQYFQAQRWQSILLLAGVGDQSLRSQSAQGGQATTGRWAEQLKDTATVDQFSIHGVGPVSWTAIEGP